MEKVFEVESFVSSEAAWHQELSFDEPYKVRVVIENTGPDPIYGFYLNDVDFQYMIDNSEVDDAIMARIEKQMLCENATGMIEVDVEFPAAKFFVCLELDSESAPDATRAEFKLSLFADE